MKRTISIMLAVILLLTATTPAFAETDYIDIEGVPYEEIIMPPWFTSPGLPYIIEPDMATWLVFYNISLRYGQIYGVEE